MTILYILLGIGLIMLGILLGCFFFCFYAPRRKPLPPEILQTPEGKIYDPFRPMMEKWILQSRALPRKDMYITSFDGLTLHGCYYEFAPGAPIELMFHGYRGTAERDLAGGVQRCFLTGRSALVVDQRCSGASQGNVITFGIKEHKDCLAWLDFMLDRFGPDVKIILTGISMGAATVMMTADKDLPPNVLGILADCGYTSAKEIILDVARKLKLPGKFCYPFIWLGAKIFGKFDLEETSPLEAVKNAKVPVIFFQEKRTILFPAR